MNRRRADGNLDGEYEYESRKPRLVSPQKCCKMLPVSVSAFSQTGGVHNIAFNLILMSQPMLITKHSSSERLEPLAWFSAVGCNENSFRYKIVRGILDSMLGGGRRR